MITDRYDPVNVFELLLPEKLELEMDPVMTRLDSLLDDEVLLARIKKDLARCHPNSTTLGRCSTPVEVILRMLIVRRLYDLSYEQTERLVSDSLVLRQFCRVYLERVPDDTILIRWTNLVGEETVRRVHKRVVALAREHKVTRGRKLRIDGTVVETNIAHPTDSGLLRDGVRVLGRLARKAKRYLADEARVVGELFRDRTRSAKRLARKIDEAGRRRTKEAKEGSLAVYRRLVEVASASLGQAKKQREALNPVVGSAVAAAAAGAVEALQEELGEVSELVERVIGQTRRRVFEGEQVPAQEKLVSIFEPPHPDNSSRQKRQTNRVRAQGVAFGGRGWDHKRLPHLGRQSQGRKPSRSQLGGAPTAVRASAWAFGRGSRNAFGGQRRGVARARSKTNILTEAGIQEF